MFGKRKKVYPGYKLTFLYFFFMIVYLLSGTLRVRGAAGAPVLILFEKVVFD